MNWEMIKVLERDGISNFLAGGWEPFSVAGEGMNREVYLKRFKTESGVGSPSDDSGADGVAASTKPVHTTVPISTYESAVKGRQDFRAAYVKKKKLAEKYGLALKMIGVGIADPKQFAIETLAKETPALTDEEDTVKSYFDDALSPTRQGTQR